MDPLPLPPPPPPLSSQTSDGGLVGAVRMKDMAVVTSPGIKPTNSTRHLRKWMELYFGRNISEVETVLGSVALSLIGCVSVWF